MTNEKRIEIGSKIDQLFVENNVNRGDGFNILAGIIALGLEQGQNPLEQWQRHNLHIVAYLTKKLKLDDTDKELIIMETINKFIYSQDMTRLQALPILASLIVNQMADEEKRLDMWEDLNQIVKKSLKLSYKNAGQIDLDFRDFVN